MSAKSNVPWSIKGINPDARVVAKKAAREAGMTLGEWMNQQILRNNEQPQTEPVAAKVADERETAPSVSDTDTNIHTIPANVVTIDQLRELVYSLNRVNERLKSTEKNSREALSGLNIGLHSVLERVRKVEKGNIGDTSNLVERLEKIENGLGDRSSINSLKALEKALTQIVGQFETSQEQTLLRLESNELATQDLASRVDQFDSVYGHAIENLNRQIEEMNAQIKQTEKTARAVMLEARAAANSNDKEFVERTSNKMRILGNEIKRSGDQIQTLESQIRKLASKMEAAEQRSAEGITRVSTTIDALRSEIVQFDARNEETLVHAQGLISSSTEKAQSRLDGLQASFEDMATKLDQVPRAPSNDTDAASLKKAAQLLASQQPELAADLKTQDIQDEEMITEEDIISEVDEYDLEFEELPPEKTSGVEEAEDTPEQKAPLTAEQKVALAAEARRDRLARESGRTQTTPEESPIESPAPDLGKIEPGDEPINRAEQFRTHIAERAEKASFSSFTPVLRYLAIGIAVAAILLAIALFARANLNQPSSLTSDLEVTTKDPQATTPPPAPKEDVTKIYARGKALIAEDQTPENRRRGFNILRRIASADPGYPPAQVIVGDMFLNGDTINKNVKVALANYEAAADAGNILAMHRLAKIYANGQYVEQDMDTAITLFEKAARYGYSSSIANLAYLFDPYFTYLPDDQLSAATSYRWYSIAVRGGLTEETEGRDRVGALLSQPERTRVDQEVANWQPLAPDLSVNDATMF
ncbi:MAG: hypothetical protein ACWA5L_03625 [bacterium]